MNNVKKIIVFYFFAGRSKLQPKQTLLSMKTSSSTNPFPLLTFLLLPLTSPTIVQTCPSQTCLTSTQYGSLPANHTTNNHFYLGGLFSVHDPDMTSYECGSVSVGGVQHLEAFLWAVDTFKERHSGKLGGNWAIYAFK